MLYEDDPKYQSDLFFEQIGYNRKCICIKAPRKHMDCYKYRLFRIYHFKHKPYGKSDQEYYQYQIYVPLVGGRDLTEEEFHEFFKEIT
jgi:hypothetical protein